MPTERKKLRQAKPRLRQIQRNEQVTKNVSRTCWFFGISRGQFCMWLRRYRQHGPEGLKNLERNHRTDGEEFYRRTTFRTPGDLAAKLRRWEHEYNHRRPHPALAGKTPAGRVCELKITGRTVQATA